MIAYLTGVIEHAEANARAAVSEGKDAHADYMFRVADAALALLQVLMLEPA